MAKKTLRRKQPLPTNLTGPPHSSEAGALTPLNFKVPDEFHRDFKMFAAQHGKKMVELLQEAFILVKEKYGR